MMPNADAIALGKQIKAVRKAMKMTQEQLALKSNVSVKYIANIENGKQNPSFDILSSILHVLPLSLDSVINPNLSEAERECRELESIYFACPPEMQKTPFSDGMQLCFFRQRSERKYALGGFQCVHLSGQQQGKQPIQSKFRQKFPHTVAISCRLIQNIRKGY